MKQNEVKRKKGKSLKKIFALSLLLVLAIVFISGGIIYKLGHDLYSSVNYVADDEVEVVETLPEAAMEKPEKEDKSDKSEKSGEGSKKDDKDGEDTIFEFEEDETETESEHEGVIVSEEELTSIHDRITALANQETISDEDIYNLLLIGVDRRDKSWNGNSDSMILVSINKKANRVTMVSLMRDTYVDIPGIGYKKLNAAYAYGAGPLLCETITNTYGIKVDRYAAVDFFDLIDIIDIIGGVDLEMTAKEAEIADGYIFDMCTLMEDVDGNDHQILQEDGIHHCDGVQAVAYARNRFVGNSDYQRTERQRYVLSQILKEVTNLSVAEMTEKMQEILKHVTFNVPETEIWSMLTELPDMLSYQFVQDRIPYDNMYDVIYVNSQDMLVPYWDETLADLHEFIYGREDGTFPESKSASEIDANTLSMNPSEAAASEQAAG